MENTTERTESIKEYYGRIIKSTKDLKTSACCAPQAFPLYVREVMSRINPEILDKFYGCGSPIPPDLCGRTVLDLGCGTGRDAYLVSKLVGEKGKVIGVDMNEAQLEVANRHLSSQMKNFGFSKPNIEFKKGYIENLKEIGIDDNSVDLVISNCVINLSPDKKAVFKEIFRALKPGGELYFSDVFAGRRVPVAFEADSVLLGECLAGALYIEDFRRMMRSLGCLDYRVKTKRRITLDNPDIAEKVGGIDFYSITVRIFKLDNLEDTCEDYGQIATYSGTIPNCPHEFALDDHHIFIAGKPMLVCGNTASMLENTRYAGYFKVTGDRTNHFGIFDCAPATTKADSEDAGVGGACC
ncbi:MAG: methyltransferase domain-containing protein [Omnitrophica bacterium]|nr:methyltransferase domain-containing protein [Candidatus Omnitrophota bacterium]